MIRTIDRAMVVGTTPYLRYYAHFGSQSGAGCPIPDRVPTHVVPHVHPRPLSASPAGPASRSKNISKVRVSLILFPYHDHSWECCANSSARYVLSICHAHGKLMPIWEQTFDLVAARRLRPAASLLSKRFHSVDAEPPREPDKSAAPRRSRREAGPFGEQEQQRPSGPAGRGIPLLLHRSRINSRR